MKNPTLVTIISNNTIKQRGYDIVKRYVTAEYYNNSVI